MAGIVWFPEDLDEWFAGDFEAAQDAVENWDDDDVEVDTEDLTAMRAHRRMRQEF